MKRLISFLLLFCMLLTMLPVNALAAEWQRPMAPGSTFTDVPDYEWYYDAVQYVSSNGLFTGNTDGTFAPNGQMTRGMFVTILGRIAGVDTAAYEGRSAFTDVDESMYYAPYVAWASRHGITGGTGDDCFSPDAPINREQMAAFFVRYFDAFDVNYSTGMNITSTPEDLDSISDWAKEPVMKLWRQGLLNGDGVSFDPAGNATRAQTAMLCVRTDAAVDTWYKEPGVESERVRDHDAEPEEEEKEEEEEEAEDEKDEGDLPYDPSLLPAPEPKPEEPKLYSVRFYDGNRLIDRYWVLPGEAPGKLPTVEKYSKEGAVLVGFYLDQNFTKPFYPTEPIYRDTRVYAQYEAMASDEILNTTTYTQLDMPTTLRFAVQSMDGTVINDTTVFLETKDGSEAPALSFTEPDRYGVSYVSAQDGFVPGGAYELHLRSSALSFADQPETVRSASFTIYRPEEEQLQLNDDVVYIADTDTMNYVVSGESYPVLTSELAASKGSFNYGGTLAKDDIVCVYVGVDPRERSAVATDNDGGLLDPAVYVKITGGSNGTYKFAPLDEEDQLALYELPDNFPFYLDVKALDHEAESGTVNFSELDIPMYENMMGSELGTYAMAAEKINVGDFITLYTGLTEGTALYFGRITEYDETTGVITYEKSSEEEILNSMNLNANIQLAGTDLISDEQAAALTEQLQTEVEESDFAVDAAYMLADMVTKTDGFRGNETIQSLLLTDENGDPIPEDQIQLLGVGGFELNNISINVDLIRSGEELHFSDGVQMRVNLSADFDIFTSAAINNDDRVSIKLNASFIEEVSVSPGVQGELTHTKILGIPVPNGVKVEAHVDIKNYTNFDFDAELYTLSGSERVSRGKIAESLENVMTLAERTGISEEYEQALQELMDQYSEMVTKETDWVRLVEEEIFSKKVFVYGIVIGIEASFVVRADMSLAIGSELEYEVGKRYSFWFKIGLYKPTAGSDTMDLIDESFAFRFYVMGKLGVRAGVKAKLSAGIGIADIGIAAEMGPYLKLWGFFVYEYDKFRPANSKVSQISTRRAGALTMEFGLYFMLSFEADALGLFEYSYDFLDEEVPLLRSGNQKYYYDLVEPEEDEMVLLVDADADRENGISMPLPEIVRTMKFVDLKTGIQSTEPAPAQYFNVTLSNPLFSYNQDTCELIIETPPENVYFLECEMTITYTQGKQIFSDYDMTITIPLVYTLLSYSERQEYKYVSVCVTDDVDNGTSYETVWSRKVLKGQPFDLPTSEEIQNLAKWSDLKYTRGNGYVDVPNLTELTVISDTVYYYDVDLREYSITVDNIQNEDGTTRTETFTTIYGGTFDFSSLKDTGTNIRDPQHKTSKFTRFTNVTTTLEAQTAVQRDEDGKYVVGYEVIDLNRPITGKVAEALMNGGTATANYADNSVSAIFSFSGINLPDMELKLKRGDDPAQYTEPVAAAVALVGSDSSGLPLAVRAFSPALGPINESTSYTAYCVELTGEVAEISFLTNDHCDIPNCSSCNVSIPAPIDKMVGSLIFNLPVVERTGYTFTGWYGEFTETYLVEVEPQPEPTPEPDDSPAEGSDETVAGSDNGTEGESDESSVADVTETPVEEEPESNESEMTPDGSEPDSSEEVDDSETESGTDVTEEPAEPALPPEPVYEEHTRTVVAKATTKTVPDTGITLYATWIPNTVQVTFDAVGGNQVDGRTVTYHGTYGEVSGRSISFPKTERTGYYFLGWYTAPDEDPTRDETSATQITAKSYVTETGPITLYAHWRKLVEIPQSVVSWGNQETVTYYAGATGFSANVSIKDVDDYPTDGYRIEYLDANNQYANWSRNEPTKPGTYHVRVYRPADDTYLAFDARRDSMLTIKKGTRPMTDYDGLGVLLTVGVRIEDDTVRRSYSTLYGEYNIKNRDGATVKFYGFWTNGSDNQKHLIERVNASQFIGFDKKEHPDISKYGFVYVISETTYWRGAQILIPAGTPVGWSTNIDDGYYEVQNGTVVKVNKSN